MHCVSEQAALPDSGMCLAFNQKQQNAPDRSVDTRAAPTSNMKHNNPFWFLQILD